MKLGGSMLYVTAVNMSAPSKVNKENFRLLELSSDEESEDLQLEIIPSRKKKVSRRERTRGSVLRQPEPNIGTEVQCALKWAVRGTLLLWLLMLTWICAALYDQVSSMRMDVVKVSTSSASVGDSLQVCHTAAKELHSNVSVLSDRFTKLEEKHQQLSKKVEDAMGELATVSEQLSAAPKLADTPRRLAELQRTVADFGSQINGFDGALNSARKQAVMAATAVEEVKTLLHELEARTNETIANVSNNLKRDEELKQQVTTLNTTLEAKMEALKTKIEEVRRPASTAAPAAATAAAASSAPAPAQVASAAPAPATSASPPGPPVKPNVLQ